MELFDIKIDSTKDLLPKDGTVNYYGKILNHTKANNYLKGLLSSCSQFKKNPLHL